MKLYLVQHGIAKDKAHDPARPLSEEGIAQSAKVASCLASLNIGLKKILHSPKLRAKETAEIFASELCPVDGISEGEGLLPKDDPNICRELLVELSEEIMIIGHLPHISKLASLLLAGNNDKEIIKFKNSAIVALSKEDDGLWVISYMLTPDLIR